MSMIRHWSVAWARVSSNRSRRHVGDRVGCGRQREIRFLESCDKSVPNDRFTRLDLSQNTFLRVRLPKPDCNARPSDCADIDVLNTLDGFQRATAHHGAVHRRDRCEHGQQRNGVSDQPGDTRSGHGFGERVGINQVSWDPWHERRWSSIEEQLNEHTRYVLVAFVTGSHET